MSYYITTTLSATFENAVAIVTDKLREQGFGVLTEIDVKETMKKKLDVDFYNYKILGACNPPLAHKALLAEDKIGTMLPCNVILQERETGKIEVSAVDPMASMQAVKNEAMGEIAADVTERLKKFIASLA